MSVHPDAVKLLLERLRAQGYNLLREPPSQTLMDEIGAQSEGGIAPFTAEIDQLEMASMALTFAALHLQSALYEQQSSLKADRARTISQLLDGAVKLSHTLHRFREQM